MMSAEQSPAEEPHIETMPGTSASVNGASGGDASDDDDVVQGAYRRRKTAEEIVEDEEEEEADDLFGDEEKSSTKPRGELSWYYFACAQVLCKILDFLLCMYASL